MITMRATKRMIKYINRINIILNNWNQIKKNTSNLIYMLLSIQIAKISLKTIRILVNILSQRLKMEILIQIIKILINNKMIIIRKLRKTILEEG